MYSFGTRDSMENHLKGKGLFFGGEIGGNCHSVTTRALWISWSIVEPQWKFFFKFKFVPFFIHCLTLTFVVKYQREIRCLTNRKEQRNRWLLQSLTKTKRLRKRRSKSMFIRSSYKTHTSLPSYNFMSSSITLRKFRLCCKRTFLANTSLAMRSFSRCMKVWSLNRKAKRYKWWEKVVKDGKVYWKHERRWSGSVTSTLNPSKNHHQVGDQVMS